jgi:DNA-binding transcriptional ArsR family regulator
MRYNCFMALFIHPSADTITLTGILNALSDPMRLKIVKNMMDDKTGMSCCGATPCPNMAKSTLSHHFRILREAGLIYTEKKGVEHRNQLRLADINGRFPGLLKTILKMADR